ncbi:MAG: KEOPS complex subunit Pcc1 [Methanobacteriota archaeon]
MKIHCTLTLDYKNPTIAHTVYHATKIDDEEFVKSEVHKNQIQATITSTSVSSLIHTLDDYLACVTVAETVGE